MEKTIGARRKESARIPIGTKFGKLEVIEELRVEEKPGLMRGKPRRYFRWYYDCKCECGEIVRISGKDLKGRTTHPHCIIKLQERVELSRLRKEYERSIRPPKVKKPKVKRVRTSERISYERMKDRCYNSKNCAYANYGGRGIRVCEKWLGTDGFLNFIDYMGPKPTPKHTIDRFPDNDGNYEPNNVRWATKQEQLWSRPKTSKI